MRIRGKSGTLGQVDAVRIFMATKSNKSSLGHAQKGSVGVSFFAPLRRTRLMAITMLGSLIVAAGFAYVDVCMSKARNSSNANRTANDIGVRMANEKGRVATEVLFLASEMDKESGPNYGKARQMYAQLLADCIARMQDRVPAVLFATLNNDFSPKNQLQEAIDLLAKDQLSEVASSIAIKQAATLLNGVGLMWSSSTQPWQDLGTSRTPKAAAIVNQCIAQFEQSFEAFKKEPVVRNAERACVESRLATAEVLNYWTEASSGKNDPQVQQLIILLESLKKGMLRLAESLPAEEGRRIKLYAGNVERRQTFLTELNRGGIFGGQQLLLANLPNH